MRTTAALLALLLVTSYDSFAGSPCPVEVTRAARDSDGQAAIEVEYKNLSEKPIVGIAMGVDMYGEDGSMKPLFFELRDRVHVAPGQKTEGSWAETMYYRDFPRVNVFVKKVKFADEIEWKDDGSGTCNSGLVGLVAKGKPSRNVNPNAIAAATVAGVSNPQGHGSK